MTDQELVNYVKLRDCQLCQDEIMEVIDVSRNPSIDHIEYANGIYNIWTHDGTNLNFTKRNWN